MKLHLRQFARQTMRNNPVTDDKRMRRLLSESAVIDKASGSCRVAAPSTGALSLFVLASAMLGINFFLYCTGLAPSLKISLRLGSALIIAIALGLEIKTIKFSRLELVSTSLLILSVLIHGEGSLNLLLAVLYSILARRMGAKLVFRVLAVVGTALILTNVAMLLFHVLNDYSYISTMGRFRRTLGFENPNQTSLFFCAAIGVLLVPELRKVPIGLIVFAIITYVASSTDSRGLLVCGAVFFVSLAILSFARAHSMHLAIKYTSLALFYGVIIASFCLPLFAGTGIDELLSGRPSMFKSFVSSLSIADWMIGSPVDYSLDNFFLVATANYGLVILTLMLLMVRKAVINLSSSGMVFELSFICGVLAYAFVESFLFRPEIVVTLMFWSLVFIWSYQPAARIKK